MFDKFAGWILAKRYRVVLFAVFVLSSALVLELGYLAPAREAKRVVMREAEKLNSQMLLGFQEVLASGGEVNVILCKKEMSNGSVGCEGTFFQIQKMLVKEIGPHVDMKVVDAGSSDDVGGIYAYWDHLGYRIHLSYELGVLEDLHTGYETVKVLAYPLDNALLP